MIWRRHHRHIHYRSTLIYIAIVVTLELILLAAHYGGSGL